MLLQLQQAATVPGRPSCPFSPPNGLRTRRGGIPRGKPSTATVLCPRAALPSRTQRIMEKISSNDDVGGAGGASSYNALKRLDQLWSSICAAPLDTGEVPEVVSRIFSSSRQFDEDNSLNCGFDVLVCGGTLGIFVATTLISKGLRVGIVERNLLKGREQEWNISRKELMELVQVGILSEEEIEEIIAITFNPNRCGFEKKGDIWVKDILNLGVSPAKLLEIMKKRFVSLGGIVFEGKCLSSIRIYNDAAVLQFADGDVLSSRLVVDSMGNFSPVVKQIRSGRKPDGVCLVVGTCSRGFSENSSSDIIFSSSSAKKVRDSEVQYFWEAFPSGSGPTDRTTYLFTYTDAHLGAPKLEELLEDYWDLLPAYQGVSLDQLEILRVIFGIFPTYRDSPLPAAFDRIIQVGDASGIQSPVSFGGFGSMTRHLSRLSTGIYEAVMGNFLDAYSLGLLNPYMPNLSASWLFQRAMSAKSDTDVSSTFINELLYVNFQAMQRLGDSVLRPFLQDVIQFGPLVKTLGSVMLNQPQILPSIFKQNDAANHGLTKGDSMLPLVLNHCVGKNLTQRFSIERQTEIISRGCRSTMFAVIHLEDMTSVAAADSLHVGVGVILGWSVHFVMLGHYTFLSCYVGPVIRPWMEFLPQKKKYEWNRHLEAWKYGAGLDYKEMK